MTPAGRGDLSLTKWTIFLEKISISLRPRQAGATSPLLSELFF
jgi:hypothetical protein